MADSKRKLYWDTGLFICFLNRTELDRRKICEDILYNAQDGQVELYTSMWTIAEVVRPGKSLPNAKALTGPQIDKIQRMFEWRWLKKITVDHRIASYSAKLSRDFNLRPADAVHAASAIRTKCDVLQVWDRDFSKIAHLIRVDEPAMLSKQVTLLEEVRKRIGPHPDDFPQVN